MSENNRNIDELFRQELGNATEAPPSSVWEILEQRLDQASPPKRGGIWSPYRLFVLFLIVAALIATYFIWHSRDTKDNKPVHNETGSQFNTRITDPALSGQLGSGKDTAQMLQAGGATAKDSLQEQPGNNATAHTHSAGMGRGYNKAAPASAPHERPSAQSGAGADRNTAKRAGSDRQQGRLHGKQDEGQTDRELQHSDAPRQANPTAAKQARSRNTNRQARATESSTAQQRPIAAALKHTAQGAGEENGLEGTKPGQNSAAATAPKTGKLSRPTGTDGAGVSKELLSSSAHGARTQSNGKGQSAASLTTTEQSRQREKAVNTEQAAAIPSAVVSAKAMPAGNSSKETSSSTAAGRQQGKISKETAISGSGQTKASTAASAQEQLPGKNANTGKVVAEQAKTASNSRTEALATGSTNKSVEAPEQNKLTEKTVNTGKAAAEQAKTASNSSKEALANNGTNKSVAIPEQNKLTGKTVNTGKEAAEQAKTASNSSTEALATNSTNKSVAIPEQNKLTGKTVNTAKAAAEQAKTASKSNTEALATGSTNKSAVIPEQNKLAGKTVNTAKAAAEQAKTASKSSKETLANNSTNKSVAIPEQNKLTGKTVNTGKAAAEQAKTASNSSKEALATNSTNKSAAIPEQNKLPGKTLNTGKAAEQAKTASNSSTEALATGSTNKSVEATEQNKLTGNAATQTKTRPAVKGAKDTIAQSSISAARKAQNKTPEKTGSKGKTGTPLSVPGAKAQNTARQAKTERKPVPQGNAQQEHKEKKAATGKNEIPQNESPEDQATAGGESSGGNALPLAKEKTRRPLNMSAGVKAAYEKGFQSYTANTVVASVFGEVNFSPKVSFIIQPGIKLANTSSEYRTGNGTYIRAGTVQSTMIYEERDSSNTPTGFRNYAYSQTYDSIVASRRAQRKFTEFELPFMVRYKMDNNLSFLAGMNFTFGKALKMEGMLQTYSGLLLTDTIFRHYDSARIAPPAPAAPAVFSHPGSVPFSAYKDPGATEVINMIRFGYTIGLSYTLRQRLIVDLTLQQNLSRLSDIDDQQIKKLFTQPYVRLSVGYSILGKRK